MFTLIYNEIRKLVKRPKTIIVYIAFIALIAVVSVAGYKSEQRRIKSNTPEAQLEMYTNYRESLLDQKNNAPEDEKASIDSNIKEIEKEIMELESLIKSGKKERDWKAELRTNIEAIEKELANSDNKSTDKHNQQLELNKLKYLYDNNINPQEEYAFNGFNFLKTLVNDILGSLLLVIGVILFVADIVSGECTPPTLKFLLIQPVSRGKVLLSKFIAVTISAIFLIISSELIFFVIIGLLLGFGNPSLPVITGTLYKFDYSKLDMFGNPAFVELANSSKMVPVWQYTLNMLLMQTLFIVACVAFAFLVSSILKSSMASMTLGIISVIMATILSQVIPAVIKRSHYLFISYGNISNLFDGNLAQRLQNPSITTTYGITVLLVWTIVCYLISHFVFTKRDILI
ncbi:ABC transporter permease subunit [Clostridium sp. MSJ-11]|uniref:ABC transporter permease subunit n=1 Tax=Clostridium mobile TaxID=2841512 RepID=A0ABS6EEH6_9CLOT|nr:ABC transporter permease subunit [Clostridium mobile]MBU5482875.1 ABC transporter permease subunit [Clostridium mobile]